MTDLTLAAAATRDGAEEANPALPAFRALYAAEYPHVARYAHQLLRDADLAADVAQEAFTRLLARWRTVREPRRYLFRIATNLVRDAWRDAGRDQERLAAAGRAGAGAHRGPDTSVRDAVDRLPRRYRDVVLLYYYGDLPVPEVAAAVHLPPGSVKRMLSEARALLARSLGDNRE